MESSGYLHTWCHPVKVNSLPLHWSSSCMSPIKLFSPPPIGEDNERRIPSPPSHHHKMPQSQLRAAQLSQTRAREAKKKALEANIKTEQTIGLLLEDSLRMRTAMQWVRQLETEISLLKAEEEDREEDEDAVCREMTCCQAPALCLGTAGARFMLGRYNFSEESLQLMYTG